jgi:hypothetical protein
MAAPHSLWAQWTIQLSAGGRYSSALVRDSIVTPITVRPTLGAAFALTVTTPVQEGWAGEAAVDVTVAGHEAKGGGTTTDLGGLTAIAVTVAVRRTVRPRLAMRGGAGALFYAPERDAGVFRAGTGGVRPLGVAAVEWTPPTRWGVALEARYDIHRFTTPALRGVGLLDSRVVHRIALAARAGLGRRP